jgi:hypothetical protein
MPLVGWPLFQLQYPLGCSELLIEQRGQSQVLKERGVDEAVIIGIEDKRALDRCVFSDPLNTGSRCKSRYLKVGTADAMFASCRATWLERKSGSMLPMHSGFVVYV